MIPFLSIPNSFLGHHLLFKTVLYHRELLLFSSHLYDQVLVTNWSRTSVLQMHDLDFSPPDRNFGNPVRL